MLNRKSVRPSHAANPPPLQHRARHVAAALAGVHAEQVRIAQQVAPAQKALVAL